MAKYKRYDYKQSIMIPVSLEGQLVPGTLEFAIHIAPQTTLGPFCLERGNEGRKSQRKTTWIRDFLDLYQSQG